MAKSVGLVLGSGGARGWAHIGVIRALQAAQIPITHVVGASIGAFVGAIYAAGELDDLEDFVRDLDWRAIVSYFDVVFPYSGLLDGSRIYDLLSEHLQSLAIEEATIPFCCVATDLGTGEEVHLKTGPMVDAVRASISIPGIFTPFEKDGCHLGDGGIINPVPVTVARDMGADVIIAVNLNSNPVSGKVGADPAIADNRHPEDPPADAAENAAQADPEPDGAEPDPTSEAAAAQQRAQRKAGLMARIQSHYEDFQDRLQVKLNNWMPDNRTGPNIFDVIGLSLNVMEQQVTRSALVACPPEILIEPDLSQYSIFDFHQAETIIRAGYRSTERQIPQIRSLLED